MSEYLLLQGSPSQKLRAQRAWRWRCLQDQTPCLLASRCYQGRPRRLVGELSLELRGQWWLSSQLWEQIRSGFENAWHQGNTVTIQVPPRELASRSEELLAVLYRHRPGPDQRFSQPLPLQRGLHRCLWAEGFESHLVEGREYYLREIPDMPAHVVVLGAELPLVGIHLDRFSSG
jgi:hypothetical protein